MIQFHSFACKVFSFLSTNYWGDCLFPIVYSCLLCHRLIGHISMGLFLGSLFFHWSVSLFVPVPYSFDYCRLVVSLKIWNCDTSSFVCFLMITSSIWSLLWFYSNFRIIYSSSMESVFVMIETVLNLWFFWDSMGILTIFVLPTHDHGILFH